MGFCIQASELSFFLGRGIAILVLVQDFLPFFLIFASIFTSKNVLGILIGHRVSLFCLVRKFQPGIGISFHQQKTEF